MSAGTISIRDCKVVGLTQVVGVTPILVTQGTPVGHSNCSKRTIKRQTRLDRLQCTLVCSYSYPNWLQSRQLSFTHRLKQVRLRAGRSKPVPNGLCQMSEPPLPDGRHSQSSQYRRSIDPQSSVSAPSHQLNPLAIYLHRAVQPNCKTVDSN